MLNLTGTVLTCLYLKKKHSAEFSEDCKLTCKKLFNVLKIV